MSARAEDFREWLVAMGPGLLFGLAVVGVVSLTAPWEVAAFVAVSQVWWLCAATTQWLDAQIEKLERELQRRDFGGMS